MRAYKTYGGITNQIGDVSPYHKEKINALTDMGFVRKFSHYIKSFENYSMWLNTTEGGYIDYQILSSGQREAPNRINLKDNYDIAYAIKKLKEIGII